MAKAETTTARSPRGAKPVSQAFFTALETIPDASRVAVAKAAQALIRDQMKTQREKAKVGAAKAKAAAAKEKASHKLASEVPVAAKAAPKAKAVSEATAPVKRRGRKPAEVPAAA